MVDCCQKKKMDANGKTVRLASASSDKTYVRTIYDTHKVPVWSAP